tara:strand:- start:136 stop:1182 length:1047 start_codon:yes stop_codon:yes gene_type:complete
MLDGILKKKSQKFTTELSGFPLVLDPQQNLVRFYSSALALELGPFPMVWSLFLLLPSVVVAAAQETMTVAAEQAAVLDGEIISLLHLVVTSLFKLVLVVLVETMRAQTELLVVIPGSKALDKFLAAVVMLVAATSMVLTFLVVTGMEQVVDVVATITTAAPGEMVALALVVTLVGVVRQQFLTTFLDNLDLAVAVALVLAVTTIIWAAVEALASMVRVRTVLVVLAVLTLHLLDKVDLVDNLEVSNPLLGAAHAAMGVSMVALVVELTTATTKVVEVLTVLLELSGAMITLIDNSPTQTHLKVLQLQFSKFDVPVEISVTEGLHTPLFYGIIPRYSTENHASIHSHLY